MVLVGDAYEAARDRFRQAVLEAMDSAMLEEARRLCTEPRDNLTGARDADLPELFAALDAQFKRNLAHLGHGWEE